MPVNCSFIQTFRRLGKAKKTINGDENNDIRTPQMFCFIPMAQLLELRPPKQNNLYLKAICINQNDLYAQNASPNKSISNISIYTEKLRWQNS